MSGLKISIGLLFSTSWSRRRNAVKLPILLLLSNIFGYFHRLLINMMKSLEVKLF